MVTRKEFLKTSALGIASMISTNKFLRELLEDGTEDDLVIVNSIVENSEVEGTPIKIEDIYMMASSFIISERLGWYERYKFKSNLYFNLLNVFKINTRDAQHHILAIEALVKQSR